MTPADRRAHARAVAANHPSVYRRESDVSAHPPCDATSVTGVVGAAASATPAPSEFGACHATVTSINDAADRLRRLRAGRHE